MKTSVNTKLNAKIWEITEEMFMSKKSSIAWVILPANTIVNTKNKNIDNAPEKELGIALSCICFIIFIENALIYSTSLIKKIYWICHKLTQKNQSIKMMEACF